MPIYNPKIIPMMTQKFLHMDFQKLPMFLHAWLLPVQTLTDIPHASHNILHYNAQICSTITNLLAYAPNMYEWTTIIVKLMQ